jgi:hypothetical protein
MLSIISGTTQDLLHEGLDFSPSKSTASYILNRLETTSYPSSGGVFGPVQGVKVMRFDLGEGATTSFLCGETVRCAFYIRNNGSAALTPVCASPASLFDRVRVLMGGIEVEDITYHSRFAQQEELFLSAEQRLNNLGEQWGATADATVATLTPLAIPAGEERRVMCSFHIAAFKQPKKWWLAACSITLELEVNGDPDYCFAGTGADWTIVRPVIHASVFQVDPGMTSSIANYLNSGKFLTIMVPGSTYNMKAAITSTSSFQLAVQRGFSKLACVEMSLFLSRPGTKEAVTFDHPLAGATPNSTNDRFGYHASLGSSRWPTVDVEGVAEQWYRTRMGLYLLEGGTCCVCGKKGAMGGCKQCGLLMHYSCIQPIVNGEKQPCPACASTAEMDGAGIPDKYPHELEVGAPRSRPKPSKSPELKGIPPAPSAKPGDVTDDEGARHRGFKDYLDGYEKAVAPSLQGHPAASAEADRCREATMPRPSEVPKDPCAQREVDAFVYWLRDLGPRQDWLYERFTESRRRAYREGESEEPPKAGLSAPLEDKWPQPGGRPCRVGADRTHMRARLAHPRGQHLPQCRRSAEAEKSPRPGLDHREGDTLADRRAGRQMSGPEEDGYGQESEAARRSS